MFPPQASPMSTVCRGLCFVKLQGIKEVRQLEEYDPSLSKFVADGFMGVALIRLRMKHLDLGKVGDA